MRGLNSLVFDEPLEGNANYYTTRDWNDALGVPDQLELFVVTTQADGATPTLTVQVEHSPNQLDWTNLNALPEINSVLPLLPEISSCGTRDLASRAS
jgi:hypothetical protein